MLKYSTIRMVEVSDWDRLVVDTYGKPYSFQQQDGCKDRGVEYFGVPMIDPWDYENDTIVEKVNGPEEGVSFKAWLARDPKEPLKDEKDGDRWLDLFWDRNFYPHLEVIAQDLYNKGLIEEGDYTINIDW